jgi:hypothetical protein
MHHLPVNQLPPATHDPPKRATGCREEPPERTQRERLPDAMNESRTLEATLAIPVFMRDQRTRIFPRVTFVYGVSVLGLARLSRQSRSTETVPT